MAGPNAAPPGIEGQDKEVQHVKAAPKAPTKVVAEPVVEPVAVAETTAAPVQTSDVVKKTLAMLM